jgi:hypothetical protein
MKPYRDVAAKICNVCKIIIAVGWVRGGNGKNINENKIVVKKKHKGMWITLRIY